MAPVVSADFDRLFWSGRRVHAAFYLIGRTTELSVSVIVTKNVGVRAAASNRQSLAPSELSAWLV